MEELMCAKTIFQQTGWNGRKGAPIKLCQDINILQKIYEYDFDLNNIEFREYLENRGVCSFESLKQNPEKLAWHIKCLMEFTEQDFLNDPDNTYSMSGLKFDEEHIKVSLKIWKTSKGAIQDAWEIFNSPESKEFEIKQKEEEWNKGDVF